ncbi:MAG: Crp/Fnr family transcriptional regulator [Hyphomicrobiaceae bacterium]|nr:Crp/Fnr family transcriptional regulator [Hyphomicrobiaceae bacterium]
MTAGTPFELPAKCDTCVVRHKSICAVLSEDELKDFNRIARHRRVPTGQVIAADSEIVFANILDGVVKLTKTLADGRQQIVGLQFPPDFLGRIYAKESPYFAEAATDVELCAFPKDGFEGMLRRYPGLEHRLFENTLDELDSAREWMLLLGRKTARERVASLLMMIARRAPNVGCSHTPDNNFAKFTLPLTRADLADYLGLTLETVSRQITNLKKADIIELIDNREIIVPNLDALEDVAGN